MTIKTKELPYEVVAALPRPKHKKPLRQNPALKYLVKVLSIPAMMKTHFELNEINMEKLGKKEPALILMNHTAFIDMKIASTVIFPRSFGIVTTIDGFIGLGPLMRLLGCIPTNKFTFDPVLIKDIIYTIRELKSSVLMYPEASYSFDGTATPLPDSLAKFIKLLGAPVVMIKTNGVFQRDPLYNGLQLRKTNINADMKYILSPEDTKKLSVAQIQDILDDKFSFDAFQYQKDHNIKVTESFRADHLERVLYKCPHCNSENTTIGKGIHLTCTSCGKKYELDEYGYMRALDGETVFDHVPDWYRWQRECVKKEIEDGTYSLECEVDIYMLVNTKCMYKVGDGHLSHSINGFHLTGCNGKLDYVQSAQSNYSLYADYNWYEKGDVIAFGNRNEYFYCIPKDKTVSVAKARLATEEIYKKIIDSKEK